MYGQFLQLCDWIDTLPSLDFVVILGIVGLAALALCRVLDWWLL
jgi:hypothetical protein